MKISPYFIRQGILGLKTRPGFAFSVISTMALTMGALIAVLTLGYFMLIKPLPYPDQEQLVALQYKIYNSDSTLSSTDFIYPAAEAIYNKHSDAVFTQSALIFYDREVIASDPSQRTANTTYVTPEWFSMLSPNMEVGRVLSAEEGFSGDQPVAVLSFHAWQNLFDGRRDITEHSVRIAGTDFRIIGVTARSFSEPALNPNGGATDIWLPWHFNGSPFREVWGNSDFRMRFIGKLKPEINLSQAISLLTNFAREDFRVNANPLPRFSNWSMSIDGEILHDAILRGKTKTMYFLLAGIIGLLLIATANITNLFMARTAEKYHNLAIKAALGAKKSQLRFEFFVEAVLLLIVAAILSMGIAYICFTVMQEFFSGLLPRVKELKLNSISVITAMILVWLLASFFVRVCLTLIDYNRLNVALQESGKGTGTKVSKRARSWLIASQIAVATTLTFCNLALFSSAVEKIAQPMGFEIEGMVSLQLDILEDLPEYTSVLLEVERKLLQLPEIEALSFGSSPMIANANWNVIDIQSNQQYSPLGVRVDNRYFKLLDIPLIAGISFSKDQLVADSNVVLINRTFAETLSPDGNALGRSLEINQIPFITIGIVDDIYMPGNGDKVSRIYSPVDRVRFWMVLKLKPNQEVSRQQVVDVIQKVDGRLAVASLDKFSESRDRQLFAQYATATTTAFLAVLTILLAGIGLYGVLSYSIKMRRVEIGVRRAIGAKRRALLWDLLQEGLGSFTRGVLAGSMSLLVIFLIFDEAFVHFLDLRLVWDALATLVLVGGMASVATYLPLRPILISPVAHGLRGVD